MTPDIIERVTLVIWPSVPPDRSLATVSERWERMEPVYHAERIREIQQERSDNNGN
jgi:hypothetical protein